MLDLPLLVISFEMLIIDYRQLTIVGITMILDF